MTLTLNNAEKNKFRLTSVSLKQARAAIFIWGLLYSFYMI